MTGRDEVDAFLMARDVPRETLERLDLFVALLEDENQRQNLVSAATIPAIWSRHILDSLQLLDAAPSSGSWLDIGAGAGLPGIVIAAVGRHRVTLAEPRKRRVEFLEATLERIGADAEVVGGRAEGLRGRSFDVISARAVAPLTDLFSIASNLSHVGTRFVFPKGRSGQAELEAARATWQGDFRVVPSITDPEAAIIVAEAVRPKGKR